jgi:hypothetical protein
MPRLLPDDAPPERIGGLLGGKWTAEVGRREQQAFHASAGIAKGGSARRVTRRGRQAHCLRPWNVSVGSATSAVLIFWNNRVTYAGSSARPSSHYTPIIRSSWPDELNRITDLGWAYVNDSIRSLPTSTATSSRASAACGRRWCRVDPGTSCTLLSSGTRLTDEFRYLLDMIILVVLAGGWFRAAADSAGLRG